MYKEKELTNIKETILDRISKGESLNEITKDKNIISQAHVYRLLNKDKQFRDNYARARESQALFYAEKIERVISDLKSSPNGNRELTDIARLEIDSYKWIASKLLPKVYSNSGNQTNIQINNTEQITGMRIIKSNDNDPNGL